MKIVESRAPTVGTPYAAITVLYSNKKTYCSIEIQIEFPVQSLSKLKSKENTKMPTKHNQTPKAAQYKTS